MVQSHPNESKADMNTIARPCHEKLVPLLASKLEVSCLRTDNYCLTKKTDFRLTHFF